MATNGKSGNGGGKGQGRTGRPSSYRAEYAKQVVKLCELGATDKDLAEFFGVSLRTIENWQAQNPDFLRALKTGKEVADNRVERSLYQRAVGYSHSAVKVMQYKGDPVVVPYVEHCPPDVTACIFWLKNRRPDLWREKHEVGYGGTIKHEHEHGIRDRDLNALDENELARLYLETIGSRNRSVH